MNLSSTKPSNSKTHAEPRPSSRYAFKQPGNVNGTNRSSVLLISPSNEILLLHRVQTSTTFPSAHVFPGGNLSSSQDGEIPSPEDAKRHEDGLAYRICAIRETFEESGILLARRNDGSGSLLDVPEEERENARKLIHSGKMKFRDWVKQCGGIPDAGQSFNSHIPTQDTNPIACTR
jgi:8-oxo-dGTP pyrophosphatase MutT (NUDIX family)